MREATAGGGLLEGGNFLRPGSHLRGGNRVARNVQLFVGHSDLPPSPPVLRPGHTCASCRDRVSRNRIAKCSACPPGFQTKLGSSPHDPPTHGSLPEPPAPYPTCSHNQEACRYSLLGDRATHLLKHAGRLLWLMGSCPSLYLYGQGGPV